MEVEIEGHTDVDDGVTSIEAMGSRLTQAVGGCTSSEQKSEKRKGREEPHVAVSEGEGRSLRAQRYMKGRESVGEDGEFKVKGSRASYTFPVNNSGPNSQDPVSHVRNHAAACVVPPTSPNSTLFPQERRNDQIQYRQRVGIKTVCLTPSLVCRRGSNTA